MNNVLFISEANVKDNSDLLENVDAKFIRNAILKAQRIHCLPVIGSDLYNKIEDLITTGEISLEANEIYKDLLEGELQQSIIPFAMSYLVVTLSFKVTQKGLQQSENELSAPSSLETIKYLEETHRETGEYWLNRMTAYCQQFEADLSEYASPNTEDDRNIKPDVRNNFGSNIYLRGYNPRRWTNVTNEKYDV